MSYRKKALKNSLKHVCFVLKTIKDTLRLIILTVT